MNPRPNGKRFQFKQFTIYQGECGMPVSTDGVLLGAWFKAKYPKRLLDIGCGTGLLSLMLAQRFPDSHIDAIDIDATAVATASENVASSPWGDRIAVMQQDVTNWQPIQQYDAIICNPPYFTSGEQSIQQARATARHTSSFSHFDLLDQCGQLLTPTGRASFILPLIEGEKLTEYARQTGWGLVRVTKVKATERKPVFRILLEVAKDHISTTDISVLEIHQDGQYSQEFTNLTHPFYLKMKPDC